MGRCFAGNGFLGAGNITHTPAYGHLVTLSLLGEVQQRNTSAQQIDNAQAYRKHIACTGRFLTLG
jgi:4-hydroxyphenylacetate 3-monooxygenase